MRKERRVVVVGMGLRSPVGHTPDELKVSLQTNRSGVKKMPEWDMIKNMRGKVAGVCEGIDEKVIPHKYRRTMGRVAVLAALAVQDAIADSGLEEQVIASPECGISFGSTAGSSSAQEEYLRHIFSTHSLQGLQSSTYLKFMSHTCAANLGMMFQSKGPLIASCTACTSGSQGIGFGFDAIREGRASVMLCGGAEEMHFMDGLVFEVMRATSTKFNDRPDRTPRPFDADRDGLVVGEGGGCLVLEEYERAKKRGAKIYAEILGWGSNCDGSHITNPSPEGIVRVLELALADAELGPDKIQHINAHATATETGDLAESHATNKVLGPDVPISALKGYMGHTLGACGAIESIASILMMNHGFMAPTRNLEKPDPECAPLNHVLGDPRRADLSIVMNNNFAFGGVNTSIIFGRV